MSRYKSYYPLFETIETHKTLSIPSDTVAGPCEQVPIPIEIDDAAGIAGMDLIIGFDPAVLIPVDAERTSLTEGFSIQNYAGENRFMVSLANTEGITGGNGVLVNLIFEVHPEAREADSNCLIIQSVRLYDENAEIIEGITSIDGHFTVQGEGSCPSPPIINPYNISLEGLYNTFGYYIYSVYYPWLVSSLLPQRNLWGDGFNLSAPNFYLNSYDYHSGAQYAYGQPGLINPLSIYSLNQYNISHHDAYQWPAHYWLLNNNFPELWANPALLYLYGQYASWLK